MRYEAEHKERTRQQILAEAASAIKAKGPDRVGVAEVMARVGLTQGGFYAHFKSKDDLIAHAISFMFDQNYVRMFQRQTEGREPADALRAFVNAYLSTTHRDAPDRGCALAALSGDLARLPEAARVRFSAGAERLVDNIAKLLKKLGTRQPDVLAHSVVAEMVGALALSRAVSDKALSESMLSASREAVKARLGVG
jgi:TetR/AcrR family transcriptional repressor of nem operon